MFRNFSMNNYNKYFDVHTNKFKTDSAYNLNVLVRENALF